MNNIRSYIKESVKNNKEYYINNTIPITIKDDFISDDIDLEDFKSVIEQQIPQHLLRNIEIIYIGDFPFLAGRTAAFDDGAIYISNAEPTNHDILEDFFHELSHSIESEFGFDIYGDKRLEEEFLSKRKRLKSILDAEDFVVPEKAYLNTEYHSSFDEFLSSIVGYPTLLNLTMGLFVSPYGATSLREYFANGFEKYHMGDAKLVKEVSPMLYNIIDKLRIESGR